MIGGSGLVQAGERMLRSVLEGLGPSTFWRERSPMAGVGFFQCLWEKPIWEGVCLALLGSDGLCVFTWERVWPNLDPWDSVRFHTVSMHWKCGPHGELFFFHLKKEPMVLAELIEFRPCISAETVKACVLIGLHMCGGMDASQAQCRSPRR